MRCLHWDWDGNRIRLLQEFFMDELCRFNLTNSWKLSGGHENPSISHRYYLQRVSATSGSWGLDTDIIALVYLHQVAPPKESPLFSLSSSRNPYKTGRNIVTWAFPHLTHLSLTQWCSKCSFQTNSIHIS